MGGGTWGVGAGGLGVVVAVREVFGVLNEWTGCRGRKGRHSGAMDGCEGSGLDMIFELVLVYAREPMGSQSSSLGRPLC